MGAKTIETQEFYIQTVEVVPPGVEPDPEKSEFVKVEAELVELGEGIQGFAYNSEGHGNPLEFWNIFDLESGWRLCKTMPTKEEALRKVRERVAQVGAVEYKKQRKEKVKKYGLSPAVKEIEIIQEPTKPEVIPECL